MTAPRYVLLSLLVLQLAAQGAMPATPPTGEAAPPTVNWWGPEDFEGGWNLRIPLTVVNHHNGPIDNLPVTAEIDLGEAVIASGWPTTKVGGRPVLESFRLDVGSLRVVEYTNFRVPRIRSTDATPIIVDARISGPDAYVLPAFVTRGTLESHQSGPFDPKANPVVSVTWITSGTTLPLQPRYFMLYFDVVQNGLQPALNTETSRDSVLDGLHWIGRGTVVFGEGRQVTVTALNPRTRVEVYRFSGGSPVLALDRPAILGEVVPRTFSIGSLPEPWMVRANGPVVATGQDDPSTTPTPASGFLPSWDGALLGTRWALPAPPGRLMVFNPGSTAARVSAGEATQIIPAGGARMFPDALAGGFLSASATAPVLVEASPHGSAYPFVSASGAPFGNTLYGTLESLDYQNTPSTQGVQILLSSFGETPARVVVTTISDGKRAVPRPTVGAADSGANAPPAPSWAAYQPRDDALGPAVLQVLDPVEPTSAGRTSYAFALAGRTVGATSILVSPLGGLDARNFSVPVPVHVFAYHNATRVSVVRDGAVTESFVLERYMHREIEASWSAPVLLHASKPVAIVPQGEGRPGSYGAGVIEPPRVVAGPAQYRGYLVGIGPANDGIEPMVESISFGATAHYEMTVTNLGRNTDGAPLPDRALLSLPPLPPGWEATIEPAEVALAPGGTASVSLTVKAPETRGAGDRLVLAVRATSAGNQNMTDELTTITLLRERRGVGLWFEEVDGPTELTLRFQPGIARDVTVVAANTGSTRDTLRLSATNAEAGWTARFVEEGRPLFAVELASGESRQLRLHVDPPPPGGLLLPSSFTLAAASTNDTTVSAKALLNGLIAAETQLALDVEDEILLVRPGTRATFHLRLLNTGTAIVDAQLNATGDLPPGWGRPAFLFRGEPLAAVDNRLDSVAPTGEEGIPIDLVVEVPENATGGLSTGLLAVAAPTGDGGGQPTLLPLTLHVQPFVELTTQAIPTRAIWPGSETSLSIAVNNAGNIEARVRVLSVEVPDGWDVTTNASIDLAPFANATLPLALSAPPGTPPGEHRVRLALLDARGERALVDVPVRVEEGPRLLARDPPPSVLVPGVPANLTIDVTNVGNAPSNTTLSFDAPDGWEVVAHPSPLVIAPLSTARLRIEITPAPDDTRATAIRAVEADRIDVGHLLEARVQPRAPALKLLRAELIDTGQPGVTAVRGVLVNEANVTLDNVTVALVAADGRVLGSTVVERVPSNVTRVVVVAAKGDDLPAQARLVIDPAKRFTQADRSDDERLVRLTNVGRDAPLPPWLPLVALLAALLIGRRLDPVRPPWNGRSPRPPQ